MSPWQRSRARAFRNAPRVRVCSLSLTTGCLLCCCCEVWPVAVSKRGVSSQKDGDKQTLWPVISPETTPPHPRTHPPLCYHFETGRVIYRNFSCRFTGFVMKPLLFEQSKAAPRRGQAWSCLRGTPVPAGTVQVCLEKRRGDVERNRRCISERDSCCTCQRPFCAAVTTLGSRCTCTHAHTHTGWCQTLSASPVASCCERAPLDSSCVRQKRGFSGRVCCGGAAGDILGTSNCNRTQTWFSRNVHVALRRTLQRKCWIRTKAPEDLERFHSHSGFIQAQTDAIVCVRAGVDATIVRNFQRGQLWNNAFGQTFVFSDICFDFNLAAVLHFCKTGSARCRFL